MKITIETNESKISIDVPSLIGDTKETWEKQGYEIFQKCIEYIFRKENIISSTNNNQIYKENDDSFLAIQNEKSDKV